MNKLWLPLQVLATIIIAATFVLAFVVICITFVGMFVLLEGGAVYLGNKFDYIMKQVWE